jgi:hypothetical protein
MPETRASNKFAHPGKPVAPKPRQTKDEVHAECTAKAQAKADCEEAKKQSIICAAEFEHADRADEDFVDATPRPLFTPKPWPPPHSQKTANLVPISEISDVEMSNDVEMSDGVDKASFVSPCSKKLAGEDDSAVESDSPPPLLKQPRAQTAGKATAKVGMKVAGKTVKKTKADKYEEEIVPASDEEQPQEPKPKKMKVKVRDEINIAAKKIEDGTQGTWNKYGDMVKSMSGM